MEHLLAPEGTAPIDIPYLQTKRYDGDDFLTYPHRRGWSEKDIEGNRDFGGRSPHEVERFFQTWLYFGTLQSTFQIVGIAVSTEDFVRDGLDGEQLLTTSKLEDLIDDWMSREGADDRDDAFLPPKRDVTLLDKDGKTGRGLQIRAILDTLLQFVNKYCNHAAHEKAKQFGVAPSFWPVSPKLSMGLMAIGEPMMHVAFEIYGFPQYQKVYWGSNPYLTDRLRTGGWCISEVPMFGDSGSVSTDYFFGGYDCPRKNLDHSHCTQASCVATNVDTATYETKHTTECKIVDCKFICVPSHTVDIVRKGGIPIVSYREGQLYADEWDSQTDFISISHVWSDGMGNTIENALPICMLSQIQGMVDQVYSEVHADSTPESSSHSGSSSPSTSSSWISDDTSDPLSPVANNTTDHLPKLCGFWMDTLCVPVDADLKPLRKKAIGMMKDIYSSAQRVLVLDSLVRQLPRSSKSLEKFVNIYLSNWHYRLWTIQEGLFAKKLAFQFRDGSQTLPDLIFLNDVEDRIVSPRFFYSNVRNNCVGDLYPFYDFFRIFGSEDIVARFHTFSYCIRFRATSRIEDEPVCFASMLGVNVSDVLHASETHEGRMVKLYSLIKHFDSRIIFNDFPRLQTKGFGWAPRSFLGYSRNIFNPSDERETEKGRVKSGAGGLIVSYPGIQLEMPPQLRYLGSKLYFVPRKDPSFWYGISLREIDDRVHHQWNSAQQYALVVARRLGKKRKSSDAILGIILGRDGSNRIKLKHVCRALITALDQASISEIKKLSIPYARGEKQFTGQDESFLDGMYPVFGDWLESNQAWVVL